MHVVFSTKDREPLLSPGLRERLFPYLGGIAREIHVQPLAIGGVADHVHMLLSLPSTLAVAKGVQILKGNSSKWIRETFPESRQFGWQEGYGAFSIGQSGVSGTVAYIENQEEHHRHRTFREEFETFLRRHSISFEPRMLD